MYLISLIFLCYLNLALAQQAGTISVENHPLLTIQKCAKVGGCVSQTAKLVLDANWRWLHATTTPYKSCFTDPSWDPSLCPDPVTCAKNCALDGADYANTYGVTTSGPNLTMLLFPTGAEGSRLYLLSDDSHYQSFKLKNQEFSFDVDVSGLPCGTNGALYFVQMAADGGASQYANNKAGATFGTGYCDAQCRQDGKFISGEANLLNWNPNSRTGRYGSCCQEVDLWEANGASTALTAHPCSFTGTARCDSTTSQCGTYCDANGCDYNPYRLGNTTFYGAAGTIDVRPGTIRVITQFITSDNTATGTLSEIRRYYISRSPKGQVIANAKPNVSGVSGNSITDAFCTSKRTAFSESNTFQTYGGMTSLDQALNSPMVLTMSIYDDYSYGMRWLDSVFPDGSNPASPGHTRGSCSTSSGNPSNIRSTYPNTQVKFSNIKYGDIGTTFGAPYP